MIQDQIELIEARVRSAKGIPEETKVELAGLLATLKSEIGDLSKTHGEDAGSITRFAEVSAHEATREEVKPVLVEAALKGLVSSVKGFESSHPKLVQIVNKISVALSNMGI